MFESVREKRQEKKLYKDFTEMLPQNFLSGTDI